MQQKDKNQLWTLIFILSFFLAIFIFYKGSKIVNPVWVFVCAVALEEIYVIPRLIKGYRGIYQADTGWTRFIPVFGEVQILPERTAKAYIVFAVLTIISAGLSLANPNTLGKVLPAKIVMNWNNTCIIITMFLIFVFCVIRGIAYVKILRDIDRNYHEYFGLQDKLRGVRALKSVIQYITLFIPILRTIGISYSLIKLNDLVDIFKYRVEDSEYDEFEEETIYKE